MHDRAAQARPDRTIVRVELGERAYDVVVGSELVQEVGERARFLSAAGRSALVHDERVPAEHSAAVIDSLRRAGLKPTALGENLNEHSKSFPTVERIVAGLVAAGLERSDLLVALGGGILGDVAGFAAAIYRRGIAWINVPTTLLAMVDASVGGKTGVNVRARHGGDSEELRKNMAGVIHQPLLIVCDVAILASLPDRAFRSGLAECVKHGLLAPARGDPGLLAWTESSLAGIHRRDSRILTELVARNVKVKANVVVEDERESAAAGPGRMSLNLGHTFAHALESQVDLGLSHGEAVGLGLLAAASLGERLGRVRPGLRTRLEALLGESGVGLPTRIMGLAPTPRVIERMLDDKKVAGGKLRLVIADGAGEVHVVTDPPAEAVSFAIDSIRG
ncbi:MAG: 3-dehydroquinate synthase [Phycisphaeraceae bacterium]|nr:3-dehydroquinate synthase [Phycisphaeraceae bacterium]